jgi:hypothetical protein
MEGNKDGVTPFNSVWIQIHLNNGCKVMVFAISILTA